MEELFQPKNKKPEFIYRKNPEILEHSYISELYKIPQILYSEGIERYGKLETYSQKTNIEIGGKKDQERYAKLMDEKIAQLNTMLENGSGADENEVLKKTKEIIRLLYSGTGENVIGSKIDKFEQMCREFALMRNKKRLLNES